ncbi:MAG TPA: S41 family peptidase, partial [Gemmatimonadaceae bacterium]|nr:S41 family peptidase [Gemmatimonadaceae bacterium]
MKKKLAILGAVLIPLAAGAFVVQERASLDGGRLFGQVLDLVESRYVDSVDTALLYEKAARGLVAQLQDPYSELFSPRQLTQFNTTTAGRYGGLGLQIEEQPGKGVVVSKVFPHTPAEAAGAREGDMIIAIDTVGTRGWSSARIADSLRGVPGSKVTVSFARPGVVEPIKSTFTRAVIRVPAVPYAIMFDKVGYIPLQGFNESSTQEVAAAVRKLVAQDGAKGLVLDLRGNGGGFLDQSLAISNLFLAQGTELASVRGRNQENQTYTAREKPIAPDVPLVILTDQYTASASEIVAGALQDHDRAAIVGTASYGKGSAQSVFRLPDGGGLKLTTALWYT